MEINKNISISGAAPLLLHRCHPRALWKQEQLCCGLCAHTVLLQSRETQSSQFTSKWDCGQGRFCRRTDTLSVEQLLLPRCFLLSSCAEVCPAHSLDFEFTLKVGIPSQEIQGAQDSGCKSKRVLAPPPNPSHHQGEEDPGMMMWTMDAVPLQPQDPGETTRCQGGPVKWLFHRKPLCAIPSSPGKAKQQLWMDWP